MIKTSNISYVWSCFAMPLFVPGDFAMVIYDLIIYICIKMGPWLQFLKILPFSHTRQDEEHPEVNSKNKNNLKDDLSQYSLPEVQCSVHHHGSKLNEDHHQKWPRDLVLGERRGDVCCCWVFLGKRQQVQAWVAFHRTVSLLFTGCMVAFTYPKGPKAKDNDDEVNSVSQEHKHIHISHSTIVWVDEVVEELSDGHIYL